MCTRVGGLRGARRPAAAEAAAGAAHHRARRRRASCPQRTPFLPPSAHLRDKLVPGGWRGSAGGVRAHALGPACVPEALTGARTAAAAPGRPRPRCPCHGLIWPPLPFYGGRERLRTRASRARGVQLNGGHLPGGPLRARPPPPPRRRSIVPSSIACRGGDAWSGDWRRAMGQRCLPACYLITVSALSRPALTPHPFLNPPQPPCVPLPCSSSPPWPCLPRPRPPPRPPRKRLALRRRLNRAPCSPRPPPRHPRSLPPPPRRSL